MPPARSIRQRIANNENDENASSTRVTRAKAAALDVPADTDARPVKKALGAKKSAVSLSNVNAGVNRKRAALGDVSNVTKNELVDSKEAKKTLAGKGGLASKAAQNAGVQKMSRVNSTRSILGAKDENKKRAATTELKRPGSGSGVMNGAVKKRNTSSTDNQSVVTDESLRLESEPSVANKITVTETKDEVKIEIKKDIAPSEPEIEIDTKQALDEAALDLDREDIDDPLMVAEYVVEIFEYLKVLEESTLPNPDYMDHQDHLEWHLRGVLIDWLVEVHTRFHLLPETIFLAVNIIDRFLSARKVELEKLQLVGITAMFIASKYEEVLSPHVQNFKHVADDGFSEEEILQAERYVLAALNYDLSYPNPMNFLRRISKADGYDIQTRTLGKYLLEISLLDHKFMGYHPSHIAAASMYLARLILERGEWEATLTKYSGYSEDEIQPVFLLMLEYLIRPVAHEAFFKKYASKKFLKASILIRDWAKRHHPLYLDADVAAACLNPPKSSGGHSGYLQ